MTMVTEPEEMPRTIKDKTMQAGIIKRSVQMIVNYLRQTTTIAALLRKGHESIVDQMQQTVSLEHQKLPLRASSRLVGDH